VGKPPHFIARKAGFDVPRETTCLIAELPAVGRDYPLSREKLSPVLSMFTVNGWREGCERCIEMLEFGGIGHTMVIHSSDSEVILKFGLEKPAFRILINTQAALGAVGYTNELLPSMTLGPGTFGGSIISDNLSAKHLINIKRLAFETRPINPPEKFGGVPGTGVRVPERPSVVVKNVMQPKPLPDHSWIDIIEERIRLKAGNIVQTSPPKAESSQAKEAPVVEKTPEKEKPKASQFGTGISEGEIERIIKEFKK